MAIALPGFMKLPFLCPCRPRGERGNNRPLWPDPGYCIALLRLSQPCPRLRELPSLNFLQVPLPFCHPFHPRILTYNVSLSLLPRTGRTEESITVKEQAGDHVAFVLYKMGESHEAEARPNL